MANKITLGKRPKSFKRTVSFPMVGEDPGSMEVTFKYRTRSELAAYSDEIRAAIKAEADAEVTRLKAAFDKGEGVTEATQAEIIARQNAFSARYLLGAMEGWNLDIPLDREAIEQLVDEIPTAAGAIIADYRNALEGRL